MMTTLVGFTWMLISCYLDRKFVNVILKLPADDCEFLWRRQSGGTPNRALKLCTRQHISKSGLQEVGFCLVVRGCGVPHVRNQNYPLGGLIGCQALALLAEFRYLRCYADHAL